MDKKALINARDPAHDFTMKLIIYPCVAIVAALAGETPLHAICDACLW